MKVGGLQAHDGTVTVQLSRGRGLRCRIEGSQWVIDLQRFQQRQAKGGQWFTGRAVILSMAVGEAAGDKLSEREQADICRYLAAEFYRLAGAAQ